jgi:hypothetical protein
MKPSIINQKGFTTAPIVFVGLLLALTTLVGRLTSAPSTTRTSSDAQAALILQQAYALQNATKAAATETNLAWTDVAQQGQQLALTNATQGYKSSYRLPTSFIEQSGLPVTWQFTSNVIATLPLTGAYSQSVSATITAAAISSPLSKAICESINFILAQKLDVNYSSATNFAALSSKTLPEGYSNSINASGLNAIQAMLSAAGTQDAYCGKFNNEYRFGAILIIARFQ